MVVRVWQLVLFIWRHPIISCLVLLFFSPPFFPIIVYFSPLLVCIGLVIIAMVSMNMGERAGGIEDLWNGTRDPLHKPTVHVVEMQAKPARESWFGWMKKKEEKAKAWVYSCFFNQDRWHFRNTSALAAEEEFVNDNDSDEGDRLSSHRGLSHPTPVLRRKNIRPLKIDRDALPPLADDIVKPSNMFYSSVSEPEDTKPIPRVLVPMKEEPPFEVFGMEHGSPASLVVPLAAVKQQEVLKEEIVVPSPPKEEEEDYLRLAKFLRTLAAKAEALMEEPPISDYKSEQRSFNEQSAETSLVLLPEDVLPPVGINESLCKALEEEDGCFLSAQEIKGEPPKSISFDEESSALIPESGQVTKLGALLVGNGTVSDDPAILMSLEAVHNTQASSGLHGSRIKMVDHLVSPKLSASGNNRKASPEAEAETTSVFSASNQPYVIQPNERLIAAEKIIFVDDPSESTTVQSRNTVAETRQLELLCAIQKPIRQIVAAEIEPHESSVLKDRSEEEEDGLDENIESCGDVPPTTTIRRNYEPMALVSRSVLEASSLSEDNALVTQSITYPDELELLAAYMEPVMSMNNDVAALTTSGSLLLDESYSLSTLFTTGGGEEEDDLTGRFYALKKSMSFHTTGKWEEPISLEIPEAATNVVVPVYIPDMVTRNFSSESLAVSEKKNSNPNRVNSENVESVESITARLQKKFIRNLGYDITTTRPPPTRPVPALPASAIARVDVSVEPVESDKSANFIEGPIPPIDFADVKSKLTTAESSSPSKKSLTSFLTRRREKSISSPLMEAFSNSGEGEGGKKMGSTDTVTVTSSAEISAEDRDEGSTTTSGRLLKERMISPLKRVFSIDASASSSSSSSSRKVHTLRVSSVKSLPVREKQSVIDKSKTRVKKLFSSEGGLTKLEPTEVGKSAVLDTISLKKSKSVSRTREQNSAFGDGENALIRGNMSLPTTPKSVPSSEVTRVEDVEVEPTALSETVEEVDSKLAETAQDADSKLAETAKEVDSELVESAEKVDGELAETVEKVDSELPETEEKVDSELPETEEKVDGELAETVEKGDGELAETVEKVESKLADTVEEAGEEVNSKLEPIELCPTEERMPPPSLESGAPDDVAKVRDRVTKSSIQKKFPWSWTKSEKPLLPGIVAASVPQTAEEFDSKMEPLPSCPTEGRIENVPPTLDTGRPDDSRIVKGDRASKSSRERRFSWSWTKSEKGVVPCVAAKSLAETVEDLQSKLEELEAMSQEDLLPCIAATAPADTAEESDSKLGAKVENNLLPGIAAAAPVEMAEELEDRLEPELEKQPLQSIAEGIAFPPETAELDSKLERVLSSPIEKKMSPPTVDTGETNDSAKVTGDRVTKPSSQKKLTFSWTKKKRSSEPQGIPVDHLRSRDDVVSSPGRGIEEESREILLSPLPRFKSSSAMSPVNENAHTTGPGDENQSSVPPHFNSSSAMSPVNENAHTSVPGDENHLPKSGFVRPDSNSNHPDPPKTDSPHKKSAVPWWTSKTDNPPLEKVVPHKKEKKASNSWWSRRNSRADSKAVPSSCDLCPTDVISNSNNVTDRIAVTPEKSGRLSPLPATRDRNMDESFVERNINRLQDDIIPDDDHDLTAAVPRSRHRRERSESLPASRGMFSRLRGRQTSLSEIALPRTPELELSPACPSKSAADHSSIETSTCLSTPQRDEDHLHKEDVKGTRNGDRFDSSDRNINNGRRSNSTPITSYQIKPSSVRTLDHANEQFRGSPFHRSDLDVSSRLFRNSPSGAEIRITDKLKVPLEEVLSLFSTRDSDEQQQHDSAPGDIAGDHRKAYSSSSSEEEISSEEEWSATSDDEDKSQQQLQQKQQQPQQKQQQCTLLPTAGRIRRRLPHYIFSRGEATVN